MLEKTKSGTRVTGFYRGIVKAHCDNGKCKIFWPGVMPLEFENDSNELPEAEQAAPLFCSSNENHGIFFYPEIGTTVWGFFENEDINHPVYFASSLGFEKNSSIYNTECYKTKAANSRDTKYIKVGNLTISLNTFDKDIEISNEKSSITMTSDGNININASKSINITATAGINIETENDLTTSATNENSFRASEAKISAKRYIIQSTGGGITLVGDIDDITYS